MKFSNLPLSIKQSINSSLVLLIMAIATLYSIDQMAALKEGVDALATNWLKRTLAISTISQNTADLRIHQLERTFAETPAEKQAYDEAMTALIDQVNDNMETYEGLKADLSSGPLFADDEEAYYEAYYEKWDEYTDLFAEIHKLTRAGHSEPALALLNGESRQVFADFRKSLRALVWINFEAAQQAADSAESTFRSTRRRIVLLLGLTVLVSLVVALGLVRYITGPVAQLAKAAHQVAAGDLGVHLRVGGKDEIGDLTHSFNQMNLWGFNPMVAPPLAVIPYFF